MSKFVKFEIQGHLAIFTLNRPKAMNAVNQKLSEEFENALETFENDDSLWVSLHRSFFSLNLSERGFESHIECLPYVKNLSVVKLIL